MTLHNRNKMSWRHRFLALLFSALSFASVQAQELSLFANSTSYLPDARLIPGAVEYQRPVQINQTTLAALAVGEQLLVTTLPGESISFELVTTQQFLNGDTSWRGVSRRNGQLQTLSLVVGSNNLLATIDNNTETLRIAAKPLATAAASDYSGYLFIENQQVQSINIDEGGVSVDEDPGAEVLFDVSALSGSDVTVVQTLSSEFAAIGEQVDVSIEITNNLATAISNEELNVLFVLDSTEFVASSSACSPGSTGAQSTLACSLPTIAAGASTIVEYSVRLTEDSYPQIASGVFVGDVFGDNVRNDAFVFVHQDTLQDSDGDGESDFNEAFNNTNPNSASSVIASNFVAEIDLMFLYTDKFASDIGSVSPEIRINEIVEITNGYYANSDANVSFRPIYYSNINYTVSDDLNSAFTNLRNNSDSFSGIDTIRDEIGADIIVLVDGLVQNSSICGLGTTPGVGFEGEFYHPTIITPDLHVTMFTPGSGCSDIVLAHELGHNLGLNHSRREDGAEGTFPYALGHGVNGSFATIMANPSDFPGSSKVALFSNPQSTDCNGLACGVSRTDLEQGADAVFTINHTRHQISQRRTSRVLPITSVAGSSNLIMYGGASRSSDSSVSVSAFSPQDSIDVNATLLIPSEHQGQTGTTYAVISVAGAGLFYRDANGDYQTWDGELNTLQGRTVAHALSASESVDAFDNFVPASFGVDAASVTVFFAYSVSSTDVFVYSSSGVPFTIQ